MNEAISRVIALRDCDPERLFKYLGRGYIEIRNERIVETDAGRRHHMTANQILRTDLRLQQLPAHMRLLVRRTNHLRQVLEEQRYATRTGREDRRIEKRFDRCMERIKALGLKSLLHAVTGLPEWGDSNHDHYRIFNYETAHGDALVLFRSRLTSATTHRYEFVVECAGRLFQGASEGDVCDNDHFELGGIEAWRSDQLDVVGQEYAGSLERFVPWALGHLLSGTPPPDNHGEVVD